MLLDGGLERALDVFRARVRRQRDGGCAAALRLRQAANVSNQRVAVGRGGLDRQHVAILNARAFSGFKVTVDLFQRVVMPLFLGESILIRLR